MSVQKLWSRLGFRRQLVVMITGVLVAGGAVLLATQFFVLRALLSESVIAQNDQIIEHSVVSGQGFTVEEDDMDIIQNGPRWTQSDPVVAKVLTDVQTWSAGLLLAFTLVAISGAWLVSRHAARRIARITRATTAISEHDLSQRLNLPGPDDEIRQLGAAIDDMVQRLEDAFDRQEAFIANASHEFRTPLTTTRMALQIAIRQGRVPEALLPEIEGALGANRRMEDLVGALLIVARGRAGTDLAHDRIDLTALTSNLLAEQENEATRTHLSLNFDAPAESVYVKGNGPLLRSLISNLLTNAVRHNTTRGFVSVDLRSRHGDAVFTVENSGDREYDSAEIDKLMEPFHRGERSRTRNDDGSEAGTGLGLTLVKSITDLHNGTVTLEAREGGGLLATLKLAASDHPTSPR